MFSSCFLLVSRKRVICPTLCLAAAAFLLQRGGKRKRTTPGLYIEGMWCAGSVRRYINTGAEYCQGWTRGVKLRRQNIYNEGWGDSQKMTFCVSKVAICKEALATPFSAENTPRPPRETNNNRYYFSFTKPFNRDRMSIVKSRCDLVHLRRIHTECTLQRKPNIERKSPLFYLLWG